MVFGIFSRQLFVSAPRWNSDRKHEHVTFLAGWLQERDRIRLRRSSLWSLSHPWHQTESEISLKCYHFSERNLQPIILSTAVLSSFPGFNSHFSVVFPPRPKACGWAPPKRSSCSDGSSSIPSPVCNSSILSVWREDSWKTMCCSGRRCRGTRWGAGAGSAAPSSAGGHRELPPL